MWHADGPGASFVAKVWTKRPGDEVAVRTIWNHEVRSLLRLDGLPKAHRHFAGLEALGADDRGYYVIVDGGGRLLLSEALANRNQYEWLRGTSLRRTRAKLWRGVDRIAAGLVALHDQGVLHRALTPDAVFTDVAGEADFRLTGFEWSLRLSTAAHGATFGDGPIRMRAPELSLGAATYSTTSDWFDLGLLAAELIGGLKATGTDLDALYVLRHGISKSRTLEEKERRLLLDLLLPNPDERRVSCIDVARRTGLIADGLAAGQGANGRSLLLGLRLTRGSELADAIFRLTRGQVRVEDVEGQIAFVREDMASEPTVTIRNGHVQSYALHGRQISYALRRHQPHPPAASTWRAAFCVGLDRGDRGQGETMPLGNRTVTVVAANHLERSLRDPRPTSVAWDQAFPFETRSNGLPGSDAYDFLRFTNTLDALMTATRIWPVEVVGFGAPETGDEGCVIIEAAEDLDRDEMALALGLETPAQQMLSAFVNEIGEVDGETAFHLTKDARFVQVRGNTAKWLFRKTEIVEGARRYVFERVGGKAETSTGLAYLRPADLGGSYMLLERRLEAIQALREQSAMLLALESPGSSSRDTMEVQREDGVTQHLDDRKKKALAAIFRTQPMFALQGPPGTGKTALVEAMVVQALSDDPSLQFVATAQANSTVDNLGRKLATALQKGNAVTDPMVVRLDEDEEKLSVLAPVRLAASLADVLLASDLARCAPPHIADRLATLQNGTGRGGRRELSDMARLVSRAANVVLATTTSGGLETLLKEGKRFDWSLVEEAAKAHGFDLALPMLASYRMLMIGDHEQLPAFNERAYRQVLSDPQQARNALRRGAPFIPRKLGFDLEPMLSDEATQAFDERCTRWLPMVRTFGHVFDRSDYLLSTSSPISARLNEQHRMHPDICDLVRSCFYPDLRTADSARARLEGPDPFEVLEGSWLPSERIVFVDMPWVQSSRAAKGQDEDRNGRMQLSSKAEAAAVVDILGQLSPRKGCELQILAPYNRQVSVLRTALRRAADRGGFPNLAGFEKPKGKKEFGATIDGFQGEEADVVVVSLVRNNHAPLSGGVGFLSERPRLNVMLSRARRKLIFVGSWEFFSKRATEEARKDPEHRLHYLATVFHELNAAIRNGTACKVPLPGAFGR